MPNNPTDTEQLNVRNLPTWAADAIRRKADTRGLSYSDQIRLALCDDARRYIAAEKRTADADAEAEQVKP